MSTFRRRPEHVRRRTIAASMALILVTASALFDAEGALAQQCQTNLVACENALPGQPPSEWDINGAGNPTIQGFATDISVNRGQRIYFKISTPATSYTIDIYRLGWYGGNGARRQATITPSASLPQNQPPCLHDPATQLYDCGNWAVSASWAVPSDAVSGVYIARLKRTDVTSGGASHIVFVVRDDGSRSDLLMKTSDATWQAYNLYGGASFYSAPVNGRAYRLSYNRPFSTRSGTTARDFLFSTEYPMIRFLERNGYDVTYTTDVDTDRRGHLIRNHKVFLSVGHDEYWSGRQRANVEAARDAGVHLAFFSGNEIYWRTRWEPSQDGSATPYRTLVCYKETWANAKIDPSPEWTGTWRDPRFATPTNGGGRPENSLSGTAYMANHSDLAIQVPYEQSRFRIWRNTSVARLAPGQTATLAPHTVGYESDEDVDNGHRPPGLIHLSTTVGPVPQYLRDFGNVVTPGTTTHHLTLYRAASGALVFSAGTIQWSWGLDDKHDGRVEPPDPRMQQATVNLLADMGVRPATLMAGLVAATASTDRSAPTATITAPAPGATVVNGSEVTLTGTATDAGGGRVAGVEVSTDGGDTWHAAEGTNQWSYRFYASGAGTQTVLARAMDDSANMQSRATSLTLRLSGPSTLFGNRVPETPSVTDTTATELGVRFVPEHDGYVTGIRFYKGSRNTGTHTGTLWSATGTRLATGVFTNETSTGWQQLTFAEPVRVRARTAYVASYTALNGGYAADAWAFSARDIDASPLVAPRSTEGARNGLFGSRGTFPTRNHKDMNYYVDVTFIDSVAAPPAPVGMTPPPDAREVLVDVRPSVTYSRALDPSSIRFTLARAGGGSVAGSTSYDAANHRVTFTPSAPLAASTRYTATVTARDTDGNPVEAPTVWSFTTDAHAEVHTLFSAGQTPAIPAADDGSAVEVGVKFVPAVNGRIIGIRFYQSPANTGTHTGNLWTSTGTLLARATFSGETGSGWQQVRFDTPVPVIAGTTYVASYHAPNGHYSVTYDFFATPWNNPPLSTPATAVNGVYRYGASGFPTSSYRSSNYWVDPLFVADA